MIGLGISIPHQHAIHLSIGDTHQGGIIFYLDGSGGGLVATPTDGTDAYWGCKGTVITGADGTAIGTGAQNTIDIEAECTTANTAADLCSDATVGGYSDWFLPSKDELNEMYVNRVAIGGFSIATYWSSSEFNLNYARVQVFNASGTQGSQQKDVSGKIRACRAF